MRIKLLLFLFLAISVVSVSKISAQSINEKDFSNIRVDDLTDNQIKQFMQQVKSSGLSDERNE